MLQQIQLTIYRNIQRSNSRFMRRQYIIIILYHPHHSRSRWSKQGRCWMTWRVTVSSAWSHGDSDHFPPTNDSDRLLPQRLPSTRVGGSWQREQASMGSFGRGLFWKEGIYEQEVAVGGDVILEYFVVPDNFFLESIQSFFHLNKTSCTRCRQMSANADKRTRGWKKNIVRRKNWKATTIGGSRIQLVRAFR